MKATKILLPVLAVILLSAASLPAQTSTQPADTRKLVLEVLDQVNSITGDAELSNTLVAAAADQMAMIAASKNQTLDREDLHFIFSRIANNLAMLTIGDTLTLKDVDRLTLYGIDGLGYLCEATGKDQKWVLKSIREDRIRPNVAARLIAEGIIRKHEAMKKAKEN